MSVVIHAYTHANISENVVPAVDDLAVRDHCAYCTRDCRFSVNDKHCR